jgi:small subunit ribosomal protein S16
MLAIKLSPVGKKKQISYRVVINEKRSKFDGKCIEDLGWYNPHTNKFSLNAERVKHWIASGAQPTDTVHNILVTAKLIEGAKVPLHKKSKQEPKPEEEKKASAPEVKAEQISPAQEEKPQEIKEEKVEETETQKPEEPEEKKSAEETSVE